MNEIQRKQLKGLGGWLVLFQIHIFNMLLSAVQMILLFAVSGALLRNAFISDVYGDLGANPFELFAVMNSPVTFALLIATLVLTLLCIIFFYRKKRMFRIFFIAAVAVNFAFLGIYTSLIMRWFNGFYTQMAGGFESFSGVFTVSYLLFSILPAVGIATALIIALYKSHRVKNTFS